MGRPSLFGDLLFQYVTVQNDQELLEVQDHLSGRCGGRARDVAGAVVHLFIRIHRQRQERADDGVTQVGTIWLIPVGFQQFHDHSPDGRVRNVNKVYMPVQLEVILPQRRQSLASHRFTPSRSSLSTLRNAGCCAVTELVSHALFIGCFYHIHLSQKHKSIYRTSAAMYCPIHGVYTSRIPGILWV